jgi:hypothetical protein
MTNFPISLREMAPVATQYFSLPFQPLVAHLLTNQTAHYRELKILDVNQGNSGYP